MKRLALLLPLLLLAGCTAAQASVPTWQITQYTTGDSSELVTTIPITTAATDAYRVVFCLDIGAAPAGGDILSATADLQVTQPGTDTAVGFSTQLYLADTCQSTGGTEIGEAQGSNITPTEHHHTVTRAGSITFEAGNDRHLVVLLAWAKSSTAKPGDHLDVDQDYGRLAAIKFTAA